jgi:uncharacterized protein YjbJ (UPF0337 family)
MQPYGVSFVHVPQLGGTTIARGHRMNAVDKAKNTAEKAAGKVKEELRKHSDNQDRQAEGEADQTKGSLKNAGENVKDPFNK